MPRMIRKLMTRKTQRLKIVNPAYSSPATTTAGLDYLVKTVPTLTQRFVPSLGDLAMELEAAVKAETVIFFIRRSAQVPSEWKSVSDMTVSPFIQKFRGIPLSTHRYLETLHLILFF